MDLRATALICHAMMILNHLFHRVAGSCQPSLYLISWHSVLVNAQPKEKENGNGQTGGWVGGGGLGGGKRKQWSLILT